MSAVTEALRILFEGIGIAWTLLEPFLQIPPNARWLIGTLLVIAFVFLIALRRWRFRSPEKSTGSHIGAKLGPTPSLLAICEYLNEIVGNKSQKLDLDASLLPEAEAIVESVRDQWVSLYVFGIQNAGKSTFVNAFIGHSFAPEYRGMMTTVLVRFRRGAASRLTVLWPDGSREERLSPASLSKRMKQWAHELLRPREAILESPLIDLGVAHLEIVDTPGTGSAWTADSTGSIEDEIVDRATRLAAIAVVVYRDNLAEMEDHERLLKALGEGSVPTLGICNLGTEWAQAYQKHPDDGEHILSNAEARFRKLAKATCYRVDLKQSIEIESIVRRADGLTVEQMRSAIVKFVGTQRNLAIRQAVRRCTSLIAELQNRADFWIDRAGPVVDLIENQRIPVSNAAESVRVLASNPVGQGRKATAIGVGTGSLLGLATVGSVTVPPAAPVILAATGIAAGMGALFGWLIDSHGIRTFRKELAQRLRSLSSECRAASFLVPASFTPRFDTLAKTHDLDAVMRAVHDLDNAIKARLEAVKEYHVFAAAKELLSNLQEVRTALQGVAQDR